MSERRRTPTQPKGQFVAGDPDLSIVPSVKPPSNRGVVADEWLDAFDTEFWPAYPRRRGVSKLMARKSWSRVRPQNQQAFDRVMDGLDRWKAYWAEKGTEEQFIPHPATWLNQQRWEDEV